MTPPRGTRIGAVESTTCAWCGLPTAGPSLPGDATYCCFGCRFAAEMSSAQAEPGQIFGPATALGLSVFFTMNVVMLTMALWSYVEGVPSEFQLALGHFLRYGALAFTAPVMLMLGRPLVSQALTGLRRGVLSTDLLLATGVLAAFFVSVINTWRGTGHVYFEVACVILVLVTLGRWLEASGRSRASEALDQLERLIPDTVRRDQHSSWETVPTAQAQLGDRLRILAGERIPLDGLLRQGRGVVDEQFFSGESTPVEKAPGDRLLGGSLNLDGDLVLEVTSLAHAGALGRLVDAVRTARLSKGRFQQLSDLWSQRFFPLIAAVAASALLVHGWRLGWEQGLLTALSVVLIACPCALALATPVAVWAALGTAAQRGVLFRSGAALETLAALRALRWDKTGTLTTGTPRLQRLVCESDRDRAAVEGLASELTRASNHVFSRAIQDEFPWTPTAGQLTDIQTVSGRGLKACDQQGSLVLLGSPAWMDETGQAWGAHLQQVLNAPHLAALPVTALAAGGQVKGLFLLEETLRPEAVTTIQQLARLQIDQAVLTGDRAARAEHLAALLGLPVRAELLPEDKLAEIQDAHVRQGCVGMVGDGLNDAPALAAADLGIALGCGADVSRESADVCLLSSRLDQIPWAIQFSRQTVRTIRTNLAWSFGYNSLGVIVAASGYLHPALAAVLMVVSSVMVLGNSLRLSSAGALGLSPQIPWPTDDFPSGAQRAPGTSQEISS